MERFIANFWYGLKWSIDYFGRGFFLTLGAYHALSVMGVLP